MAKRNLLKAAGLALAAMGALGFGLGTSPAGQEVLTAAQQQTQKARVSSIASYLPWRPNDRVYGKLTMSPKQYGIYLLTTGKKQI